MGSKSGGGSQYPVGTSFGYTNTNSNSTQTPAPQAMQAYTNVLNQAQNVASKPYAPYTGQLVAPLTADQQAAFQGVENMQGAMQPYVQSAQDLINSAVNYSNPSNFNQQSVSRYFNPYQQNVINATMANMNEMNQEQQNQLTGNAIMAGAMGGDRTGIARAELGRQQDMVNAQVLANLQNQGYQNAVNEYNQQQQTAVNAAQTGATNTGQLGALNQNALLQQNQALLGVGGQQQAQQQAVDTANYNQYLTAQNYPYAQTGWLSGVVGSIGPQMGGTTNTQSSGFNYGNQTQAAPSTAGLIGGAATTAAGLIPQSAYQSAGSAIMNGLSGIASLAPMVIAANGGRIGKDSGGAASTPSASSPSLGGLGKLIADLDKNIQQNDTNTQQNYSYWGEPVARDMGGSVVDMPNAIVDYKSYIPTMRQAGGHWTGPATPDVNVSRPDIPQPKAAQNPINDTLKGDIGALFKGMSNPVGQSIQLPGATLSVSNGNEPFAPPPTNGPGPNPDSIYHDGGRIGFAFGGAPQPGTAPQNPTGFPQSQPANPFQPQQPPMPPAAMPSAMGMPSGMGGGWGQPGMGPLMGQNHAQQPPQGFQSPNGQAPNFASLFTGAGYPANMLGNFGNSTIQGLMDREGQMPQAPTGSEHHFDPARGGSGWSSILNRQHQMAQNQQPGQFPEGMMGLGDGTTKTAADGGRIGYDDGGDVNLDRSLNALARGESGGEKDPYAALGPVTKSGDRAYGKYQVMGANIPVWAKEAGLGAMTPEQFLANKDAQEAVARHKFGEYRAKTGSDEEAAKMWFAGPSYAKHANARDALGTSIPQYAARFNRNLGNVAAPAPAPGPAMAYADEQKPGAPGFGGITKPAPDAAGFDRLATPEAKEEPAYGPINQALIAAGLGMMASRSPFAGAAIGEGGLHGLQAYQNAVALKAEEARKAIEAQRHNEQFAEEARHHKALEGEKNVTDIPRSDFPKYGIDPNYQGVVQRRGTGELLYPGKPTSEVNVNQHAAGKGADKMAEHFADQYINIQKEGDNGAASEGTLKQMKTLMDQPEFYSGAGAEIFNEAKKIGSALGIVDAGAASPTEAFRSMSNKLVKEGLGTLGTGVSNADVAFLKDTVPILA